MDLMDHFHGLAKSQAGTDVGVVAAQRFVLVPPGAGNLFEEPGNHVAQSGRSHLAGQKADFGSFTLLLDLADLGADDFEGVLPGLGSAFVVQCVLAIRVVHTQNRGQRVHVHAWIAVGILTLEGRVGRVGFDLDRPTLIALGKHGGGVARKSHRGGEIKAVSRLSALVVAHIRDDLAGGGTAAGKACQRQGGAHQRKERAAADRIGPFARLGRKLPVKHRLIAGGVQQFLEAAPHGRVIRGRRGGKRGVGGAHGFFLDFDLFRRG